LIFTTKSQFFFLLATDTKQTIVPQACNWKNEKSLGV